MMEERLCPAFPPSRRTLEVPLSPACCAAALPNGALSPLPPPRPGRRSSLHLPMNAPRHPATSATVGASTSSRTSREQGLNRCARHKITHQPRRLFRAGSGGPGRKVDLAHSVPGFRSSAPPPEFGEAGHQRPLLALVARGPAPRCAPPPPKGGWWGRTPGGGESRPAASTGNGTSREQVRQAQNHSSALSAPPIGQQKAGPKREQAAEQVKNTS
jgi:hypothetical protein